MFFSCSPVYHHRCTSAFLRQAAREELSILLTDAYLQVVKKGGNEWILLSVLGKSLRDLNPNFQETHGKKKLSLLIEQCPGIFETRLRKVGKGQTAEVRIREQKH